MATSPSTSEIFALAKGARFAFPLNKGRVADMFAVHVDPSVVIWTTKVALDPTRAPCDIQITHHKHDDVVKLTPKPAGDLKNLLATDPATRALLSETTQQLERAYKRFLFDFKANAQPKLFVPATAAVRDAVFLPCADKTASIPAVVVSVEDFSMSLNTHDWLTNGLLVPFKITHFFGGGDPFHTVDVHEFQRATLEAHLSKEGLDAKLTALKAAVTTAYSRFLDNEARRPGASPAPRSPNVAASFDINTWI